MPRSLKHILSLTLPGFEFEEGHHFTLNLFESEAHSVKIGLLFLITLLIVVALLFALVIALFRPFSHKTHTFCPHDRARFP